MKRKKQFVTPRVLQEVQVQLETNLLGDSVQNVMKLRSMGTEVKNYDFSDGNSEGYSVYWEE